MRPRQVVPATLGPSLDASRSDRVRGAGSPPGASTPASSSHDEVPLEVLLQRQEGTLRIAPVPKVSTHGTPYDEYPSRRQDKVARARPLIVWMNQGSHHSSRGGDNDWVWKTHPGRGR